MYIICVNINILILCCSQWTILPASQSKVLPKIHNLLHTNISAYKFKYSEWNRSQID